MFYGSLTGFGGGAAGSEFLGVTFDGTNDYLSRAAYVGESNKAPTWTFVAWLKVAVDSTTMVVTEGVGGCWASFRATGDNDMDVMTHGVGCSGSIGWFSSGASAAGELTIADGWRCMMMSKSGTTQQCYFGDTDVYASGAANSGSTEDHTFALAIGSVASGATKWNGDMAEYFLDFDNAVDFSDVANRRKFFGADGKPVDLGDDGSTPTGQSPCTYLSIRTGDAATDFKTNRGTGGDFTENGALSLSSTAPVDGG